MSEVGKRNAQCGIDQADVITSGKVHYNLEAAALYEEAIRRAEATLTTDGALVAYTGQHTGRSPKDKFVVRDASVEAKVWWDNNKPMTPAAFDALHADFLAHAASRDLFVQDLVGGADQDQALPTRVITEYAWHSLFIRNLLDPAGCASAGKLRAQAHHHRPAVLPGRSGPARHAHARR